jgi:hypothetical protein
MKVRTGRWLVVACRQAREAPDKDDDAQRQENDP